MANPYCREGDLRQAFRNALWLFGGKYVGITTQRRFLLDAEIDLPLLRPDGVLQVVELKRATAPLVKGDARWLKPTADVSDAIAQVANYLRILDEQRASILADHGVEVRRSRATIVIGHPDFQPEYKEAAIYEALRTYTSHLARIDVLTYQELLESAERTLNLT